MCYLAVPWAWQDVSWQWHTGPLPSSSQSQPEWHTAWPQSSPDSVGPEWTWMHNPVCEGHPTPGLNHVCLNWKPSRRATQGTRYSSQNKGENYFRFKSQSGSKKRPCRLFSVCAVCPPGRLEFTQHVCLCGCVCASLLAPVCHPSVSPGPDSCRLLSEGPLKLGGYSFPHICYEFTRAKPFKGSFMEPSAALWLLPIKMYAHLSTHSLCTHSAHRSAPLHTLIWIGISIYNEMLFCLYLYSAHIFARTHTYTRGHTHLQFLTKAKTWT